MHACGDGSDRRVLETGLAHSRRTFCVDLGECGPREKRAWAQENETNPPMQKLPIAPIFIADKISLAVSREKDRKLRVVYAGWGDAKVVEPSEVSELRAS